MLYEVITSAPLIAGMAACLWQAHPDLSCVELTDNIQRGSSRYATPDYEVGYRITSYNVCYTKLLRVSRLQVSSFHSLFK